MNEDLLEMPSEEEQELYCANDPCNNPASYVIEETQMPLCYCCGQAYRLGMSNQHTLIALVELL